jgi:hypothetical protein
MSRRRVENFKFCLCAILTEKCARNIFEIFSFLQINKKLITKTCFYLDLLGRGSIWGNRGRSSALNFILTSHNMRGNRSEVFLGFVVGSQKLVLLGSVGSRKRRHVVRVHVGHFASQTAVDVTTIGLHLQQKNHIFTNYDGNCHSAYTCNFFT